MVLCLVMSRKLLGLMQLGHFSLIGLKGPVYRISLAARMSIILAHSEVLLGQNNRNLKRVSMFIFGVQNPKICIETQFKFLWFWPSKTSLWDSMMLILAAREILYTGPLMPRQPQGSYQGSDHDDDKTSVSQVEETGVP